MRLLAAVLALFCLAPLSGEDAQRTRDTTAVQLTDEELPVDDREFWRVEFLGVWTDTADRELIGVATGVPQILLDALEPVETHQLSRAERDAVAAGVLERLRLRRLAELHDLKEELDLLPFEPLGELERAESARELRGEIEEVESFLERLRATELRRIEVSEAKPVDLILPEEPSYSPVYDFESRARDSEADLLLYGELERSDSYLFFTLYEYNYHLRRERVVRTTAALASELSENLDEVIAGARRVVAGRPVASLDIVVTGFEPERSEIIVDGESRGFGSLTVPILPLGATEVRVVHPAVADIERTVLVGVASQNRLEIGISEPRRGFVAVVTEPPGASIYLDSVWQGVTPLLLDRPSEERQLRLSLEEYYDAQLLISPDSPGLLREELLPRQVVWEEVVEGSRDRFYRSFGWFVLSLPAPIILNGIYGNLTTLFPEGNVRSGISGEEADRRLDQANTVFYSYYATLGVSVALFGNMLVRLVQYIRTGEGYHDR